MAGGLGEKESNFTERQMPHVPCICGCLKKIDLNLESWSLEIGTGWGEERDWLGIKTQSDRNKL